MDSMNHSLGLAKTRESLGFCELFVTFPRCSPRLKVWRGVTPQKRTLIPTFAVGENASWVPFNFWTTGI